jgi:hypothetical protein
VVTKFVADFVATFVAGAFSVFGEMEKIAEFHKKSNKVDVVAGCGHAKGPSPSIADDPEGGAGYLTSSHQEMPHTVHVYTVDLPVNSDNLQSVVRQRAPKCDGFFAASNVTSHSVGAVNLPHIGGEFYKNMWQKIRSMWGYALQGYAEEFDWFYIGCDDTYLAEDVPDVKRLENGYMDEFSRHATFFANASRWENVRPRPLLLGGIIFRC